ncbi:hypothetical protein CJ485_09095 [Priestia filamentosa]|nr:hypothetical protein CJ485_09095 [Priestia filamentosa]
MATIAILLMSCYSITSHISLFYTWFFLFLAFLTFVSLTQLSIVLFGPGGMIFNIILLSLQLVSAGVMVPLEMLPLFYEKISAVLPATYVAEALFTITFGGSNIFSDVLALVIILLSGRVLAVLRISFSRIKKADTAEKPKAALS